MHLKKHLFVTVDTQEIREMSIPESGIEYEIIADYDDVQEIKQLFQGQNRETFKALGYLSKPFDEWGADDRRAAYDADLILLYRKIFETGTEKTREEIREMGILE
ncbi:hypothetical protein QR721_05975 [Aciduricibacillus chroicocephali]|uniref:Hydrolase n=1 Tax=Aciduricibacillus chroicocephali TaxID=3054939 RepID=A0ABY9KYC2_9BACI|nr:hypothetical protein QR721_05975 [Bacillaceae bacterium 44XB]